MNSTGLKTKVWAAFLGCCLFAMPGYASATPAYGVVPNGSGGIAYPSVSADGSKIAFLSNMTSGGSIVKVYDRATGTTTTCSTGIPYCSRPRISRDGTLVAYFGTPLYASSSSMLVTPIVASTSSGSWSSALNPVLSNSTTLWDTSGPQYGLQPGISNGGGSWTVSFGDLVARSAPPDGEADEWVCTSSSANQSSPGHPYYTPGEGVGSVLTDISASGSTIAYRFHGEIYVNGSAKTSTGGLCNFPSIDAAGAKVAYDCSASGGVLSSSNVYVLTVSTSTSVCPYALTGTNTSGGATHPYISSDGQTVAFNCSSSHLTWNSSYTYSFPSGSFAAQCGTSASGATTVLSADYSGSAPFAVKNAADACAYNLSSSTTGIAGAFDTGSTALAPISWGSYGTGTNILIGL